MNQDYPNLEYIVIDGNSSDGSRALLEKYDPWLAYWVSEPDKGQSNAINKGLEKANGEILAYLNSDDIFWHKDVVKMIVARFLEDQTLDMVYGDIYVMDEHNSPIRRSGHPGFDRIRLERDASYFIPQQAAFWRKTTMDQVGFFDEALYFKMDRDFYIRIAKQGKISYIPQIMGGFRTHAMAKSNPWNAIKNWREWEQIRAKNRTPFSLKSETYCMAGMVYGVLPEKIRHWVREVKHKNHAI